MTVFSATFSAVAVTAAQDVFEIAAPVNSRVMLREIKICQYSDPGDAQAEILSISLVRGNTVTGSGGSTPTPVPLGVSTGAPGSIVKANNTTPASGGSPVTVWSDVLNVANGFVWRPRERDDRIIVEAGARIAVRLSAPVDSLTMNGTIVFDEIGLV